VDFAHLPPAHKQRRARALIMELVIKEDMQQNSYIEDTKVVVTFHIFLLFFFALYCLFTATKLIKSCDLLQHSFLRWTSNY
jgi:hypothetical protein